MTRRVVGVDAPSIQARGQIQPVVQGDFSAAENAFNNAASNTAAAYDEQIRGLSAKMQTVQAKAEQQLKKQQAGGAAVGEAIAGALQGVAQGLGAFEEAKAKRKETEAALKAADEKARQEALKQYQEGNYSSAYQGLAETLLRAQDELSTSTDKEGVFAVQRQGQEYINGLIASGQIGPEQAKTLNSFLFENIDNYQRNQIDNTRSVQRKTEDASLELLDAEHKQNINPLIAQIRAGSSDPVTIDQLDKALTDQTRVRVEGILNDPRISEAGKMTAIAGVLNYTRENLGEAYTNLSRFAEASRRFEQYQPAIDEANRLYEEGDENGNKISLQERDRRIAAARTQATGDLQLSTSNRLDAEKDGLSWAETQRGMYELNREKASDPENRLAELNDVGLGQALFQILDGTKTLESFNHPGAEDIHAQLSSTLQRVQKAQEENKTLGPQVTSLQADMARAQSRLQTLRDFAQPMAGESQEDFQRRRLRAEQQPNSGISLATLEEDINKAQVDYQEAQTKLSQLETQYTNNYQLLQRYNLQDGLAGYAEWASSETGAAQLQQYAQTAAEIEANRQSNANFRTRNSQSQGSASTTVGGAVGSLATVGGDAVSHNLNLRGVRAPFLAGRFQPNQVHITAHIKDGSHEHGNALDFTTSSGQAGTVTMTSGRVVRAHNGCRVGDSNCGAPRLGGYGNIVVVEDDKGRQWLYAHLQGTHLKEGDTVRQGQFIGEMGDTGSSQGAHVHLSVWQGEANYGTPVPVSDWALNVKEEPRVERPAVPSMGVSGPTPTSAPGPTRQVGSAMPGDAITFSNGAMYYQGRYYQADEVPADFRSIRNARTPSPNSPSFVSTPVSRPARGVRASAAATSYKSNPNPGGSNFGYKFLNEQAGFRTKLNQVAQTAGIPTQWLADILAATTGGSFTNTQIKDGRAGLALFSPGFLQSMNLDAQDVIHMSHGQQLDLLQKMLLGSNNEYAGKYRRMEQVAMAVLSGGDKELALTNDYKKWDGTGDGKYSIWNWLRRIGSNAGREYSTIAETYDPITVTQTRDNGATAGGRALATQTGGNGTAPAWTGDGRRVAATELPPQIKAFLDLIFDAESGVGGSNSYRIRAGGGYINSLDRHPDESRDDNATGRYQFIGTTWAGVAARTGLRDFSPRSQDLNAAQMLRDIGVYDLVMQGKIQQAVYKAASTWAGFPKNESDVSHYEGYHGNTATIRTSQIYELYNRHLSYYQSGIPAFRSSR